MVVLAEASTNSFVMPGLDPGIHHSSQKGFLKRWIAGSSPAMTSFGLSEPA